MRVLPLYVSPKYAGVADMIRPEEPRTLSLFFSGPTQLDKREEDRTLIEMRRGDAQLEKTSADHNSNLPNSHHPVHLCRGLFSGGPGFHPKEQGGYFPWKPRKSC